MELPSKNRLEWIVWRDAVGSSSRAPIEAMSDVSLAKNTNLGWVKVFCN